MIAPQDEAAVALQLGRTPRGLRAVAHRCPCGLPDVVETAPRLPDGTPFPTLYYLTCPRATAALSGLEASGLMREMTARLAQDAEVVRPTKVLGVPPEFQAHDERPAILARLGLDGPGIAAAARGLKAVTL